MATNRGSTVVDVCHAWPLHFEHFEIWIKYSIILKVGIETVLQDLNFGNISQISVQLEHEVFAVFLPFWWHYLTLVCTQFATWGGT